VQRAGGRRHGLLRSLIWLCLAAVAAAPVRAQTDSLRASDVVLRFWPQQQRLAAWLMPDVAALSFAGMPADMLARGIDITVFVAPDAARFDSLTGGRAPEWGAGVAFPQRGEIVLPGYVSARTGTHSLPIILRHELAHVVLQRRIGDADMPRWFTEGYATWAAGQFDDSQGWRLRLALLTGRAPPLDSLSLEWPLIAADAELAYLLAASAVRYLHSLGSPATFDRFLDSWAGSGSFEHALRTVYVISTPQFERLWRAHVRRHYGWVQIIAQSIFVWSVLTLLVLLLFIIRRRRDRGRMQLLRQNELPDEPAYWQVEADAAAGVDVAGDVAAGDGATGIDAAGDDAADTRGGELRGHDSGESSEGTGRA
jgi:hypothetical protein